jgi:hypothetical protein
MDLTRAHGSDDVRDRCMLWDLHFDAGFLQRDESAASHAVAHDNVDVVGLQSIDVVAGVRAMVKVGISHDLGPTAVGIHHREERCASEVAISARFQSAVILRRYTNLHDELLLR